MPPEVTRLHELIWISHSDVISKGIENIVQAAVRPGSLFQRECTIEMSTVYIARRRSCVAGEETTRIETNCQRECANWTQVVGR